MWPVHFLPIRVRALFFVVVGTLWILLFGFGTIRMLLEREWGYAMVTLAFALAFLWGIRHWIRILRAGTARTVELDQARTADPIE